MRGGSLEAIGTAAFIDPGDADALARETLRLIEDEAAAHAMGERGKELYGARFRPAVVAVAYDDLYARMLAR